MTVSAQNPVKMRQMKRLLPLLFLLLGSAVSAESGTYRVEVIIFRNLAVHVDAEQVDVLYDFSRFPALEESNLPGDLPDDLLVLTQKSTYMDGVWRRLRSSKGYRPLIFAGWEQNRTDYYPPMRIHDEVVLETRAAPPSTFFAIHPPIYAENGDGNDGEDEGEAEAEGEAPLTAEPVSFYRLDGTVQLKRSRFLHLYLNLDFREELPVSAETTSFFEIGNDVQAGVAVEPDHGVYRLQENRQIRTGTMQYFDTPYFGALVYVTPLSSKQN